VKDYRFWVYILGSRSGTLYVGMTNDLERRLFDHRAGIYPGFASRYGLTRLLYFEETTDVFEAITREKQIKGWSRGKKILLLESINPSWRDLSRDWVTSGHPEERSDEGSR
jgi:putative endonuclease